MSKKLILLFPSVCYSLLYIVPAEEFCDTWEKCIGMKNLPEDEFMKKYGDEVLAPYKIPSEEEIAQVQLWDEDEDENASDDDDNILEIYD